MTSEVAAPVRLLVVDDSEDDARLALRALERAGLDVRQERVDSADALRAALARGGWDAVLSDYRMPGFTGLQALEMVRGAGLDIPFILVSGEIGEETAVQAMKAGASDYVMKDRIGRLAPSLERELKEARLRAEHRRMQADFVESEARYRDLVESSHDLICTHDLEGRLLSVNEAATRLTGYPREKLLGMSLAELLDAPVRADFAAYLAGIRTAGSASGVMRIRTAAGEPRWWEYRNTLRTEGVPLPVVRGTAQDVTERRRHDARQRGEQEALLALSAPEVVGSDDLDAALRRITETNASTLGVARASVWRYSADHGAIACVSLYDARTGEHASGGELRAEGHPAYFGALETLRVVAADDARGDPRTRELAGGYLGPLGIGALLDAPIRSSSGVAYGVLCHEHVGAPRKWHEDEKTFAVAAANLVSLALERRERREAQVRVARLNRVYAVLSAINNLIVRTRDRQELFESACRIAVDEGKFISAAIATYDPETGRLAAAAQSGAFAGFSPGGLDTRPEGPFAASSVARAVRERRPVWDDDLAANPGAGPNRARNIAAGAKSIISLPLFLREEVAGALVLFASEKDFFDEEEVRLLAELAGDLSFALDYLDKASQADFLAYYDPLTGLPNARLFRERLVQLIEQADSERPDIAVAFVDIDRFGEINETFGRAAGDELLRQFAARYRAFLDGRDTLARVDGDCFAVARPARWDEAKTAHVRERFKAAMFDAPYTLAGQALRIGGTSGVAFYPADAADADALIARAEAALKRGKERGDAVSFYSPEMTARVAEKLSLENKLRHAIEAQELVLHYQPKVSAAAREITGLEALIRWQSPELGLVPPGRFIALMEETGLILEAGAWALKRAALDHRAWAEAGLEPPRVAVNVSAIQLRQADFVQVVARAVAEGVAPACIDLEITESLIMQDVAAVIMKLEKLRELGIRTAIDDFGTGYSSLAYLARLPVETLKIDRVFIVDMLEDPDTATLVRTMIALAHSLDKRVVAEGVETEEQAKMLHLLRCDEIQGYLLSRPVPADAVPALLAASQKKVPDTFSSTGTRGGTRNPQPSGRLPWREQ